jgi:hypothetical protein
MFIVRFVWRHSCINSSPVYTVRNILSLFGTWTFWVVATLLDRVLSNKLVFAEVLRFEGCHVFVMMPTAETASLNSSFIDLIWYYMYELSNVVLGALGLTSNIAVDSWSANFLVSYYERVVRWLAFDEFQFKLLKGLLFILCANIFLIYMSWKVYGKRISEKFMRPGKFCTKSCTYGNMFTVWRFRMKLFYIFSYIEDYWRFEKERVFIEASQRTFT